MSEENENTFSRRAALVTIGQAAIGVSIAGRLRGDAGAEPAKLPVGVYLPSNEHLGHALLAAERFHPIPEDCPTDYVRPLRGRFVPAFFSDEEFRTIARITNLLLGTESAEAAQWIDLRVASAKETREAARGLDPLCRALAVAYFGPAEVAKLETANAEETCREGLEWLAGAVRARGAEGFTSVTEDQQIEILDSIGDARADRKNENAGSRFLAWMKAEAIRGYYTSQAGLKELNFRGNAFYARSPGCDRKISLN